MKRLVLLAIVVFLGISLISSNQSAFGQNSAIYLSDIESGFGMSFDSVSTGRKIVWTMAFRNNSGGKLDGHQNGFRIYSPSGAAWTAPVIDTLDIFLTTGLGWHTRMEGGTFFEHFTSGSAADTVGIGGFAIFGPGFEDGFDAETFTITIPFPGIDSVYDGGTICLDSSFYLINPWLWSVQNVGAVTPDWSGPHCYTIVYTGNNIPPIISCQASLNYDHCQLAQFQYTGSHQDTGVTFSFNQIDGPGSINSSTGLWSYQPSIADVGVGHVLTVVVEISNGTADTCQTSVTFTNVAPVLTSSCETVVSVKNTGSVAIVFEAQSGDCDPYSFLIGSVVPSPMSNYSINPVSGVLSFNADTSDAGELFIFDIGVTDGKDTTYCQTTIDVSCCKGKYGDTNGDGDDANILDLTYIVDFIFRGGLPSLCDDEADLNGDGSSANIIDLTYLVDFIFRGGPAPNPC